MSISSLILKSLPIRTKSLFRAIAVTRCYSDQARPAFDLMKSERFLHLVETKARPEYRTRLSQLTNELNDLSEMRKTSEKDMLDLVHSEIKAIETNIRQLEEAIIDDLILTDDHLINSLILEINCGVGGQEAMLFAAELLEVYSKYAISKRWALDELSRNDSELGGINSASLQIEGKFSYQHFRHEAGVHRVQRIPRTEKSGRIHTSTVTVNVLPVRGDAESEIQIHPEDLKFDTKRSTGAGGQHVNKTESCSICTHIPTGTVTECQETRSLIENKARAVAKLKNILFLRKQRKLFAETLHTRKSQVSSADRSEKIRTYNFVQDRITDHRLSDNIHEIKDFMKGNPEKLDALIAKLENKQRDVLIGNLIKSVT